MKTVSAKSHEVQRAWHVVDANNLVLGRMATRIAKILRGKHKPSYTPHADTGDYVIVINADKVRVTGDKTDDKLYYRHSGTPGGLKTETFKEVQKDHPGRAIEIAVKGMMPKGPLGREMLLKLKVYAGAEHPHTAQQPQPLNIEELL